MIEKMNIALTFLVVTEVMDLNIDKCTNIRLAYPVRSDENQSNYVILSILLVMSLSRKKTWEHTCQR